MATSRIACVHCGSDQAQQRFKTLACQYDFGSPEESDVIVALGGDGLMLQTIHKYRHLGRPIFGMNCGTVGFLMNDYQLEELPDRIAAAQEICLYPLAMEAEMADGRVEKALAFNEVSVTRHSARSANMRITIDGVDRLAKFVGDGLVVSTAVGNTVFNGSAHSPIIPLGPNLLALTPVSPLRPGSWKGALLPRTVRITLQNLDPGNRPLAARADFREIFEVLSITILPNVVNSATLLFDPDRSLEEQIVAEQFSLLVMM